MSTPINDFAKKYSESDKVRFHMPGHKGMKFHGLEEMDITEIKGADYLFEDDGIIRRSEEQMALAFGSARTFYSTEGSSLCIKTMLGILKMCRKSSSERSLVIAPRNVHKAFINACILLDLDVNWVYPEVKSTSVCCGMITAKQVERAIMDNPDAACVYVTSPDYLGNISDIKGMAQVCHSYGIPLLVDNAHGAYFAFLHKNIHPMCLGADMCCDSAHKTLPCYTGGAMLHISKTAPKAFSECGKNVMSLFASTSPSYLIMESLDLCADYVSGNYSAELEKTVERVSLCKKRLESFGWTMTGNEESKITICADQCGYNGDELAELLRCKGIEPEYSDCRYVVMMMTPFNKESDYCRLEKAFSEIPVREPLEITYPEIMPTQTVMSIRKAAFSPFHTVQTEDAEGKICAMTVTSCQPSVPVVVSGEKITAQTIKILKNYGILSVNVL